MTPKRRLYTCLLPSDEFSSRQQLSSPPRVPPLITSAATFAPDFSPEPSPSPPLHLNLRSFIISENQPRRGGVISEQSPRSPSPLPSPSFLTSANLIVTRPKCYAARIQTVPTRAKRFRGFHPAPRGETREEKLNGESHSELRNNVIRFSSVLARIGRKPRPDDK